MFDIGFTELLVIGVVALIVVGPKDLPTLFRTLGRFTARMRALGREFTSAMNDAADQTGMKDVAKDLKGMTNPASYGLDKLKDAADKFDNWSPSTPAKTPKKPAADDPERAADVEKIRAATEAKGREKLERERAAATGTVAGESAPKGPDAAKPATKPATAKHPAAKPAAASQAAAKPAAAKKPAAKKPAAAKPAAAGKPATKAPATKAPATKTAAAKPAAAKKPAAKKPAAKKPAAGKTAAKKPATPKDPAETKTDTA